ncbi:unnamed protein product [Miscanthus lutarioriparius]|uniref:Uncharacterized protein n=1 Tax=Miscanthus lutarioriparius TaxID=422564 RepID=A0A811R0V6_9POAL|nr:unnamed protein product [Miscanthus lutarioriparius]
MTFGGSSSAQGIVAPKFGKRMGLPLVPCPKCGEEIMELTCGPGSKVPRAIFFKCRLHERCAWNLPIVSIADKYEKMLIAKGYIEKTGLLWPSLGLRNPCLKLSRSGLQLDALRD